MKNPLGGKINEETLLSLLSINLDFRTMDDYDFENKYVLVRTDMNLPINPNTKEATDKFKVKVFAESTLRELLEKNVKGIAVMTHQGRPGDKEFTTTIMHAKYLSNFLGMEVKYIPDVYGEKALEGIRKMKEGEYKVIMLENVRTDPEEMLKKSGKEHSQSKQVQTLSQYFDVFINDAFAASHRPHASITGYPYVMPSVGGRIMEWEVRAIKWVNNNYRSPAVYFLGGAKLDDSVTFVKYLLENSKADWIYMSGLSGNLYLKARGYKLGKVNDRILDEKGGMDFIKGAEEILSKFSNRILTPVDLAVDMGERREISIENLPIEYPIKDIGTESIGIAKMLIDQANTIVITGPPGVYEEERFAKGTKLILKYISESNAFSLAGGGHTVAAINSLGLFNSFTHVSTGGGALTEALSGKRMPGIEALIEGLH